MSKIAITAALAALAVVPSTASASSLSMSQAAKALETRSVVASVPHSATSVIHIDGQSINNCDRTSSRRIRCTVVQRGRVTDLASASVLRYRSVRDFYVFKTRTNRLRVTWEEDTVNADAARRI